MTRASKALAAALLIAVSLVGVVGCSHAGSSLDETQWRLTGWSLGSLSPSDFAISAEFAGGKISGNGGVNRFGGPYAIGPGDAFSAGPLASTRMAGPEPAMRAEGGYLGLLGKAKSYKMTDGKLILYDEDGNESLIFEAASCAESGVQCQLAEGPLGVCERSDCAPGETPPCFQCTPQH